MKRSRESEESIDTKRVKNDIIENSEDAIDKEVRVASDKEQTTEVADAERKDSSPLTSGNTSKAEGGPSPERKGSETNTTQILDSAAAEGDGAPKEDPTTETSEEENRNLETKSETAKETYSDKPTEPLRSTGFSSFGSGFSGFGGFAGAGKFGAKLNSAKQNPWAEPSQTAKSQEKTESDSIGNSTTSEENKAGEQKPETSALCASKEPSPEPDTFATVKLSKQEVRTGEEDEEAVFQMRVRLYAIDLAETEQKTWKERGTGLLKLNKLEGSEKFRLVMRADGVLRVSLNVPVGKNMQLTKGFPTSLHTEKFVKFTGFEDGKLHQYAVRCGSESQRDELHDSIKAAFEK